MPEPKTVRPVSVILAELDMRDLTELALIIAKRHHVTLDELLGRSREKGPSRARQELWGRLYENGWIPSYSTIGRIFGRDHNTIQQGIERWRSQPGTTRACLVYIPNPGAELDPGVPEGAIRKVGT